MEPAALAYQAALRLGATEAWYGLGCARLGQRAFGLAAKALQQALAVSPSAEAHYQFGIALFELGRVDAAVEQFEITSGSTGEVRALARRSLACIIPGHAAASHAQVLQARSSWIAGLDLPPRPPLTPRTPGRKLRIGYLSAFFGHRNWMKSVWGVINHHDRARFAVHLFSDGADPSAESGYCDAADDRIYQLRGVDAAALAAIVAEAGIDVLVDLNGYSVQDRLAVPLSRPAPVVVGWFNMFATTGSGAFDWLVGDAAVVLPEEEKFYPERIHRVPGSYLAFQFGYPTPPVEPPPALQNGYVTFGCLGSQYKLTDDVLAAWGAILRGVPQARLLLRNAALADASTQTDVLGRLEEECVDPARITLLGRAEHDAFLATYRLVDIALDTFPYNGGTTTTEALWQGVPVLTFNGDRWASRTSRSLLLAAGLADWVMPDARGYVMQAIRLARDPQTPQRLAALRGGLRAQLLASAACDCAGLCRSLEAFYEAAAR